MAKNETILESAAPAPGQGCQPAPGGCSAYRLGLVLGALQKKLAQAQTEEEKAGIRIEIEALEDEMGF